MKLNEKINKKINEKIIVKIIYEEANEIKIHFVRIVDEDNNFYYVIYPKTPNQKPKQINKTTIQTITPIEEGEY